MFLEKVRFFVFETKFHFPGLESIEDLVKLVTPMFVAIENKDLTPPKWDVNPYPEECLKKKVFIVPVKDKRSMIFIFPYPDEIEHYKTLVSCKK